MGLRPALKRQLRPVIRVMGDHMRESALLHRAASALLRRFPRIAARVKFYYWSSKEIPREELTGSGPLPAGIETIATPLPWASSAKRKPRTDGLNQRHRTPLERWYWHYSDR